MAGGEGDSRGWNGWMASPTQWTWVWASFRSWWWTGKPGMLQSMRSQRVWLRYDWATELNWTVQFSRYHLLRKLSFPSFIFLLAGDAKIHKHLEAHDQFEATPRTQGCCSGLSGAGEVSKKNSLNLTGLQALDHRLYPERWYSLISGWKCWGAYKSLGKIVRTCTTGLQPQRF